jgi:hypothetical protein
MAASPATAIGPKAGARASYLFCKGFRQLDLNGRPGFWIGLDQFKPWLLRQPSTSLK